MQIIIIVTAIVRLEKICEHTQNRFYNTMVPIAENDVNFIGIFY